MTVTDVQKTEIIQLFQGMFNASPGSYFYNESLNFVATGASVRELANALAQTDVFRDFMYSPSLSDSVFCTRLVDNLVGDTASLGNKQAAVSAGLDLLADGSSRADLIFTLSSLLGSVSEEDVNWGTAATRFNQRVEISRYYAVDKQGSCLTLEGLQAVTAEVSADPNSVSLHRAIFDGGVACVAGDEALIGDFSVGSPARGQLQFAGDEDWYRISLAGGADYAAEVGIDSGAAAIRFHDGAGNFLLSYNLSGNGDGERLNFHLDADGVFYVVADAVEGGGLPVGYELSVTAVSADAESRAQAFSREAVVDVVNNAGSLAVKSLDSGDYWSNSALTYSFNTSIPSEYYVYDGSRDLISGWQPLNSAERAIVVEALDSIAELTPLSFREVSGTSGVLRFNLVDVADPNVVGFAFYPGSDSYAGDVFLSNDLRADGNFDPGDSGYQDVFHEIGHAFGLKHPFEYPDVLPTEQDNFDHTLMSYTRGRNVVPYFFYEDGYFRVKMAYPEVTSSYHTDYSLYDAQALQTFYGANTATRTGDDVYTIDFDDYAYLTIWDAGGTDTLDLSAATGSSYLNLSGGLFSSGDVRDLATQEALTVAWLHDNHGWGLEDWVADIYDQSGHEFYTGENNIAILPGVYIENAVTGAAADEIVDNMVDNRLSCGAGDDLVSLLYGGFDRVDGGAGFDTVRIADTIADIEMTSQADGSILLLGTYFAASLTQVEQLLFADGTTLPLGA